MDDEEVANFHWHYNILNTDVEALLFKAGQHMMTCEWLTYVYQRSCYTGSWKLITEEMDNHAYS